MIAEYGARILEADERIADEFVELTRACIRVQRVRCLWIKVPSLVVLELA